MKVNSSPTPLASLMIAVATLLLGFSTVCAWAADPMFSIGVEDDRRYPVVESQLPWEKESTGPYWMDDERLLYNRFLRRDIFKEPAGTVRFRSQEEVWQWDLKSNTHAKVMDGHLQCYAEGWATVTPNLPASTPREVWPLLNGKLGAEMTVLSKEERSKGHFNPFSCRFQPGSDLELKPGRFTNALREDHGYIDVMPKNADSRIYRDTKNLITYYPAGASQGIPIQLRLGIRETGQIRYYPFAQGYLIQGELNGHSSSPPSSNPLVRFLHLDGRVEVFRMPDELWRLSRDHTLSVGLTRRGVVWGISRYALGGVSILVEDGMLKRIHVGGAISPNGCLLAGVYARDELANSSWIEQDREISKGLGRLKVYDICRRTT